MYLASLPGHDGVVLGRQGDLVLEGQADRNNRDISVDLDETKGQYFPHFCGYCDLDLLQLVNLSYDDWVTVRRKGFFKDEPFPASFSLFPSFLFKCTICR